MGSENLVYVFAAYAVIWLLSFGYLHTIASRQKRLQREMEALKNVLTETNVASEEALAIPDAGATR
ncbi:MAG: CcmD family protein [Chloroflexi bacterium]|nr:CcmD family protein [Chloroflexota bacterium]MDA8187157.1 CcmD family protein [Dehalococcoidales bacterium]